MTQPAYKVMEMIARCTAQDHWTAPCALICYKWSQTLNKLSSEDNIILQELYIRIRVTRPSDTEIYELMQLYAHLMQSFIRKQDGSMQL